MMHAFVVTAEACQVARALEVSAFWENRASARDGVTVCGNVPLSVDRKAVEAQATAQLAQLGPELRTAVAARVTVTPADRVVAAADIKAGTLLMPVTGCLMIGKQATRLLRGAVLGLNSHVFATLATPSTAHGLSLAVSGAPMLNLMDVAPPDAVSPGNVAVIDAMGAGSCGSRLYVRTAAGEPVPMESDEKYRGVRVPLLLCVASRDIWKGETLRFESDTKFWRPPVLPQAAAASPVQPQLQLQLQSTEQLPAAQPALSEHWQAADEPHASSDEEESEQAAGECPPAPRKRRATADVGDGRRVRACLAGSAFPVDAVAQVVAAVPRPGGGNAAVAREFLAFLRDVVALANSYAARVEKLAELDDYDEECPAELLRSRAE